MDIIVCGIYLLLFYILSHFFSKRPTYKRYLKIAMVMSIIIGCIYWAIFSSGETSEFVSYIFCSVPLVCLMQLEKLR
jgi:predicted PurR-regulated permease PerM